MPSYLKSGFKSLYLNGKKMALVDIKEKWGSAVLKITELTESDAGDLLEFELTNKAFFEKYVPPRDASYLTLDGIRKSISIMKNSRDTDEYYLYIIRNQDNEIVARVNLFNIDRVNKKAEVGFRVAENQAGKGIGTASLELVGSIASDALGLSQLEAVVIEGNAASEKALAKTGFIKAETLEKHIVFKGETRNAALFCKVLD